MFDPSSSILNSSPADLTTDLYKTVVQDMSTLQESCGAVQFRIYGTTDPHVCPWQLSFLTHAVSHPYGHRREGTERLGLGRSISLVSPQCVEVLGLSVVPAKHFPEGSGRMIREMGLVKDLSGRRNSPSTQQPMRSLCTAHLPTHK